MKNILLRKIEIIILCVAVPIVVLLLLFTNRPEIAIAFLIGIILGVLRLNALFGYMTCVLNREEKRKNVSAMVKYLINLLFSFGTLGFALYKSPILGVPILIGLIMVPVIIMFYSIWQGVSLYRKK